MLCNISCFTIDMYKNRHAYLNCFLDLILFLIFQKEDTLNTGYIPVPRCKGGKAASYSPDSWGCY